MGRHTEPGHGAVGDRERGMRMRAETFERLALAYHDRLWELDCGRLREKPGMTARHAEVARQLVRQLVAEAWSPSIISKAGSPISPPRGPAGKGERFVLSVANELTGIARAGGAGR